MERLNLSWLDWPVFTAVVILGTASVLVFFGVGIAWEVAKQYREQRIAELNRRRGT
jgi:hypothetical protein